MKCFLAVLVSSMTLWSFAGGFFLVGDSTMANYKQEQFPMTGWGQVFGENCVAGTKVSNLAVGGRSTKSFRDEGRWDAMMKNLQAGDVVIIQFGHNDQKQDKPELFADANGDYQTNLKRFISEVAAKDAKVILCTPVNRRSFKNGEFYNSLGDYPEAARKVAAETNTPLIDLNAATAKIYTDLGDEGSKKLFTFCKAGEYPGYPKGSADNSHFNRQGAECIAKIVAGEIKERKLPGNQWIQ